MYLTLAAAILLIGAASAQTKDSCIPGRHFNDEDGYFISGVAGLSTEVALDTDHGQKAPNSTWATGLTYPAGENVQCDPETDRGCRGACGVAPGCPQYYSTHTCSLLQFCNAPGNMEGQDIYQLPSQAALDACDFSGATMVGNTATSDQRRRDLKQNNRKLQAGGSSLCYEFPFEVDHELTEYFFSSMEGCSAGQKVAVQVNDFDETADACSRIGETTSRLQNCDCRLQKKPSTLGEPCRTEFSDRCFEIMQTDRPDDGCCDRGDCISTVQDFNHPDGNKQELDRRELCDDAVPGLCYNEDGLGTDTNRLGSTNCCTRTCTECGTALSARVLWNPCENLDGTVAECGRLSRYDASPFQCDFSLCGDDDTWNVAKCPFTTFAGGSCGGFCFAGDNMVTLADGTPTKMKDLKIGDDVVVDEHGNYGKIYSFGHSLPDFKPEYTEIHSKASPSLILSDDHMVFVEKDGERAAVRADNIKMGDKLVSTSSDFVVSHTSKTKKHSGAYAPFTTDGTIVVNGVLSSCYVAMEKSDKLFGLISHQSVAHLFESPHRLYCQYLSDCTQETYNADGISDWVAIPHEYASWVMKESIWTQILVIAPAAILLSFFSLLEGMIGVVTVMPRMLFSIFSLLAFRKYQSTWTTKNYQVSVDESMSARDQE